MELTKIHKLIERLLEKEDEKVKDFSYLLNLSNQLSREVPISDVIDEEIGDAVESIIRLATTQNFVPVVDDEGIFIGIIKRSDIINYCYNTIKNSKKIIFTNANFSVKIHLEKYL